MTAVLDRRAFLRVSTLGSAAVVFGGSAVLSACDPGDLLSVDTNGLRVHPGFTGRVVATTGSNVVGTDYEWHGWPDGGACFELPDGGWSYVSNCELKTAGQGGAGFIRFDADANIVGAGRCLTGTTQNCSGGATPWGTWLSCEEIAAGQVWECDPIGVSSAIVRPSLGSFRHEAAACHEVEQVVYLTEDRPDGGLYRFVPDTWTDLSSGVLQVLTEVDGMLDWAEILDPAAALNETRFQVPDMKVFNGGEGIDISGNNVVFTTKGDNRVWSYDPFANELTVIYDVAINPNGVLTGADGVTTGSKGVIYVAEDGGDMQVVLVREDGSTYPVAQVVGVSGSEITGLAFNPAGDRLYFSSQRNPGTTYEVRGPWNLFNNPTPTETPTTTSPDSTVEGREGHLDLFVVAKQAFDQYTEPTDAATWATMRSTYDAMMVFEPYFDERVELFDDHYGYIDFYGLAVQSPEGPAEGHLELVLQTASGAPVYIPFDCSGASGCTQYAADVGNPAYQDAFVARIAGLVARGYRGIMIDDVNMLWRFSDSSGQTVEPMNPRTGQKMRINEWRQSAAFLLERVRAEFPDIKIMHNAVWFADTPGLSSPAIDDQIAASDLFGLERGANDGGLTGGDGSFSYKKFIDLIDRVHRLGSNVVLIDRSATTAAEQTFNLATGLLVNDGGDLVSTENLDFIAPGNVWSGFSTDLGAALGPYQEADGIWRRDFSDGIVVLSEPQSPTRTVQLGGSYVTSTGQTITQVNLSAREAVILHRPGT